MSEFNTWKDALAARNDLDQYGDNSIGLFALELRFSVDDIHSVAADSLTDGNDDKKCDLVYIDKEEKVIVVAQCYMSSKQKQSAKSDKASDLNIAIAWLLQREIEDIPVRLQSAAKELRSVLSSGMVKRLEMWYVHNLPESINVREELSTVEQTANSIIKNFGYDKNITVSGIEIGDSRLEQLYVDTLSPILVNDEVLFEIDSGFEVREGQWKAYVAPIYARQLYRLFRSHNTKLFSANVRDYLGSRNTDANINNGIKQTAKDDPENFWVFNNGITVLTHAFQEVEIRGKKHLKVNGVSIVNGAQTTGAIGSLSKLPDIKTLVPARFVATSDQDLVYNVIQYNNSQNKVTASDFRSTDRIQRRLREEIAAIPDAKYEGGRRGGYKDVIERNKNLLPSYTVGQALAAFNQDAVTAYNQKSVIWVDDKLYARYFNEDTNGSHIVFCYGLLRAVEDKKQRLVTKSKSDIGLTTQEDELLIFFRRRGSTYLLVSAISSCLETFLAKRIPNSTKVSFGQKVSPRDAIINWTDIVSIVSPFSQQLLEALNDGLKSNERAQKAIGVFRSLVQATVAANTESYAKFSKKVVISK